MDASEDYPSKQGLRMGGSSLVSATNVDVGLCDDERAHSKLPDIRALDKFSTLLTPPGCVCVEYIWVTRMSTSFVPGHMLRSKTRVLQVQAKGASCDPRGAGSALPTRADQLPEWGADGLSVAQGDDWTFGQPASAGRLPYTVHMILRPVRVCPDPFRGPPHLLALCEAVFDDGSAPPSNHRARARAALAFADKREPGAQGWWAFEQEYTLYTAQERDVPMGFTVGLQKEYLNYCGVGADAVGRAVQEAHLRCCLAAGLQMSGTNLEVLVGSCEFQVGPGVSIDAADQLWLARYILARVAEDANVFVSFDPKPLPQHDGCGLHTNFSTRAMRMPGGWNHIVQAMGKLAARHRHHLAAYGPGNERRLTGGEEYSDLTSFSWGVGDRGASVRVAFEAAPHRNGCGYFEDRRPGSNADPYLVILQTAITLWGPWQDRPHRGKAHLQPLSRLDLAEAHKRLSSEDVQHERRVAAAAMAREDAERGVLQGQQELRQPTSEAERGQEGLQHVRATARRITRGPVRWGPGSRRALSLAARMPSQVAWPVPTGARGGMMAGGASPSLGTSEDDDDEEDETETDEESGTEESQEEDGGGVSPVWSYTAYSEGDADSAQADSGMPRRAHASPSPSTRAQHTRSRGTRRPLLGPQGLPVPPLPPAHVHTFSQAQVQEEEYKDSATMDASSVVAAFLQAALDTATSLTGDQ